MRGLISNIVGSILATVIIACASAWYADMVKREERAGMHLGFPMNVLVASPWLLLLVSVILSIAAGYVTYRFLTWRTVVREKAAAAAGAAPAHVPVPPPQPGRPLRAEVMGFSVVDAGDLTREEFDSLWNNVTGAPNPLWYNAWVQLTVETPARAKNWRFSVKRKDGTEAAFRPTDKRWSSPKAWPNLGFEWLDQIENAYLTGPRVYNVLVFLHGELASQLNLGSFTATFHDDGTNRTVVARIAGQNTPPGSSEWMAEAAESIKGRENLRQQVFALETAFRTIATALAGAADEEEHIATILAFGGALSTVYIAIRRHLGGNALRGDPDVRQLVHILPSSQANFVDIADLLHRAAQRIPADVPPYVGPWET